MQSEYMYKSNLGKYIKIFIDNKLYTGHPYSTSRRILQKFDNMIFHEFPNASGLTKDICDRWISHCKELHPNTLLRRITPIRQLGKYLSGIGVPSYIIPGNIPKKAVKYEAHIFTEQELTAFFKSVDACPKSPFSPARHYVIPVIFRLIFCCGMRQSEARKLLCEDVDLSQGQIKIRESKGWKARLVYVSDDMLKLLNDYDKCVSRLIPNRTVFFPNQNDVVYSPSTIDVWFHEFWDTLPEAKLCTGNRPRVHDFRHSYCVYRLNKWVREGANLNGLYPYMSEFLGHCKFADTDYYISLVPSFYSEIHRRMASVNDDILPEVINDDN